MKSHRGKLGVLILLVAAAPVAADMNSFVGFTYTNLNFQYDQLSGRTISIADTNASSAVVQGSDGGSMQRSIIQSGSNFDFRFDGTVGTAAQGYAISGVVSATDIHGTPIFEAQFNSTSVQVVPSFQGTLVMGGTLTSLNGSSSMLTMGNRGGPWIFDAGSGSDVQLQNYDGFNGGQLFHMSFGIDATSLATAFDYGAIGGNLGVMQLTSTVAAPVSPALLLGGVGFATLGLLRRRLGIEPQVE